MAAAPPVPELGSGDVGIRLARTRDAGALQRLLADNREWLRPWEATHPTVQLQEPGSFPMRPAVKAMLRQYRLGLGVPFVITYRGEVVGQLSLSGISGGSLSSAQIGYWVSAAVAGRGITTLAVALATDYCLFWRGLHRVEICIRPENRASLRVVEKLGFRPEGVRERYIHIDGDWRDHESFALTAEDVPEGVLNRFLG